MHDPIDQVVANLQLASLQVLEAQFLIRRDQGKAEWLMSLAMLQLQHTKQTLASCPKSPERLDNAV